jgi:hypothetical protein
VAGACEHGIDPSASIEGGEFCSRPEQCSEVFTESAELIFLKLGKQ